MENVLENIFIVSISFGGQQITRLIFAVNKQDAIHTINEYYSNPNVVLAISYNEIKNLSDFIYNKNEEDFYLVIERIKKDGINILLEHYERNNNIEILYEKYKYKDCFFCNQKMIEELIKQTEDLLNSNETSAIFSNLIDTEE